jgi:hypothetical protein
VCPLFSSRRPEDEEDLKARCHFSSAKVDNIVYCLGDDVYVKVYPAFRSYITVDCFYYLRFWHVLPGDAMCVLQ